jgi:hypothetical protein
VPQDVWKLDKLEPEVLAIYHRLTPEQKRGYLEIIRKVEVLPGEPLESHLYPDPDAPAELIDAIQAIADSEAKAHRKPPEVRVLVVSTDTVLSDSTAIILRCRGYNATVAHSCATAVKAARRLSPDVLIAFPQFELRGALDMALQVRQSLPACTVLFICLWSAASELAANCHANDYGFEIRLMPLHPLDLLAWLRSAANTCAEDEQPLAYVYPPPGSTDTARRPRPPIARLPKPKPAGPPKAPISEATRRRIAQVSSAIFAVTVAATLARVINPLLATAVLVLLAGGWLRWIAV